MYRDSGYKLSEGSGSFGVFGNPDLQPQKTISYELGLQYGIGNKYKIDIITAEQFYTLSREQIMYGGSNSTFPYKHFESAFNKITNTFKDNNTTNKKVSSSGIKVNPEESQETNTEKSIIPNIEIVDIMMT